MKRTVYRDRTTGRFVSKSTWKRSRAQDGIRYARQRILIEPKPEKPPEEEIEPPEEEIERKPIRDLEELDEFLEETDEEFEEIEFEGAFDSHEFAKT